MHVKEPLWCIPQTQVAPLRHGLLAQGLPVMTTAVKDGAAITSHVIFRCNAYERFRKEVNIIASTSTTRTLLMLFPVLWLQTTKSRWYTACISRGGLGG